MKRNGLIMALGVWVAVALTGCGSSKNTIYFQDIEQPGQTEPLFENYSVKIHQDDLLAIMVNSVDAELALPFNMPMVTYQIGNQGSGLANFTCTKS